MLKLFLAIVLFCSPSFAEHIESRVVGGLTVTDKDINRFPYQVSFELGKSGHVCGGSILDKTHIITAGHCATWTSREPIPADRIRIRVGTQIVEQGGQVHNVTQNIVHKRYGSNLNDIAVLVLETPLVFSDKVKPIELNQEELPSGTPVLVSGWGKTGSDKNRSEILKYTTSYVLTEEECGEKAGLDYPAILCLNHVDDTGACQGDSGGPAVFNGKLVGVASTVPKTCGKNDAPDGYAKVKFFYSCITDLLLGKKENACFNL